MLNQLSIMGRFTAPPELKYTSNNTAVLSFTLAVDRDYSGKDKEKQTDFIECVAWRHTAEFISKYFSKGSMAVVTGKLYSRKWTDKDGNKRTAWEAQVDNIYFADSKKPTSEASEPVTGYEYGAEFPEFDDDSELPY